MSDTTRVVAAGLLHVEATFWVRAQNVASNYERQEAPPCAGGSVGSLALPIGL